MSTEPSPDDTPAEPAPAPPRPARRWGLPRSGAASATAAPEGSTDPEAAQPTEVIPAPAPAPGPRRLRQERRRLLTRREESVYHLGGLAFELYRRDLLPDGVMRMRAAEVADLDDSVRDIDVRLSEVERERRERRTAGAADQSVGSCMTCRAPFRAEARYCWQCGAQVVPPPVGGDDQVTQVIPSPGAG